MPIPPDPVLVAAARWLGQLEHSVVSRARTVLNSTTRYSDVTPTQYAAAYDWLVKTGALDLQATPTLGRPWNAAVFRQAVTETLWFADADDLVRDPLGLPDDALRAADALELSHDDAFALVVTEWGKVDTARREQVGLAGELALLKVLNADTVATVTHVAAESDGYGFDIAVKDGLLTAHLEVKTTTRRSRLTIYLSRHEFETALRDPHWTLVAVRLDPALSLLSVATVDSDWIRTRAPLDRAVGGRWESARLNVPPAALTAGLCAIASALQPSAYGSVLSGFER